ncbi:SusC/RagA family TonB-linked outer membrane protein [Labilibaculum euxinus]
MKLKFSVRMRWLNGEYRVLLAIVLMNLIVLPVFGQKIPISGVVKSSSDGDALPGVNVIIKGTYQGTITDINGAYSLEVEDGETLVFSFIGFETKEVSVKGQNVINVSLKDESQLINDVVVIGYGTTTRKNITGAISSISADEIVKTNPTTLTQALQGQVAGVMVQAVSGRPGSGNSVSIRGITSLGGSQPLYVIDGVRMSKGSDPTVGLNTDDIASVDVLKDASATAIYGTDGTDGVIIITTKRGHVGAPTISYGYKYSLSEVPKKYDLMNLKEYATFLNERSQDNTWSFDARPEFANPEYLGVGTDWQDALFRMAPTHDHTISVNGGDEVTQYVLSGSYNNTEGIALGSSFERMTFKLKLDNQTTKWMKIGTDVSFSYVKENKSESSGGVIQKALEMRPNIPVQNADGSYGGSTEDLGWVPPQPNPYALALINDNKEKSRVLRNNSYAEINFIKGLKLRNEFGVSFTDWTADKFEPTYQLGNAIRDINSSFYQYRQSQYLSVSNYLTYNHMFADHYNLTAMVGHEAQLSKGEDVSAGRSDFPSNTVKTIGAGDATTATNNGRKTHNSTESYFGRVDLGLFDKYILQGNVRYDGSSIYAKENRWILSYSGSVAWNIKNENFLKNVHVINALKLRGGYGLTNRAGGTDYAYASVLSAWPTALSGVSQITTKIGSPDLTWEQTKSSNIGLDVTLFDWRLNIGLDFYLKQTDELALQVSLPSYADTGIGYVPGTIDAPYGNLGSMENKGFEFKIGSTNIKTNNFTWKTNFTFSLNRNKVVKLNSEGAFIKGDLSRTVAGRAIGEFYGYEVEGVYASPVDFLGDEAKGILPHARPAKNGEILPYGKAGGSIWYGDLMFKDQNGDGIIDESDQTYLGSPIPLFQIGFNNSVTFKNFDLNIFFSGSYGNKIYNKIRINTENPRANLSYFSSMKDYAKLALVDPEGSDSDVNNVYVVNADTKIHGVRNDDTNGNTRTSDRYIEDGSFLKCKSVTLGYRFSEHLLRKANISSLRVYASVTNLFTITNYSGLDPEIGSWNPRNAGVDSGYYPQPRIFTFGVNLSLSNK